MGDKGIVALVSAGKNQSLDRRRRCQGALKQTDRRLGVDLKHALRRVNALRNLGRLMNDDLDAICRRPYTIGIGNIGFHDLDAEAHSLLRIGVASTITSATAVN